MTILRRPPTRTPPLYLFDWSADHDGPAVLTHSRAGEAHAVDTLGRLYRTLAGQKRAHYHFTEE